MNNAKKNKRTLDTQHQQKINLFKQQCNSKHDLEKQLILYKTQLESYKNRKLQDLHQDEFDEYIECTDNIHDIEKQLKNFETIGSYYISNADTLFKYYDLIEKNQTNNMNVKGNSINNTILKYFVETSSNVINNTDDRATLLDKYMANNDTNYIKQDEPIADICSKCGSDNRNIVINEGIVQCNNCFCVESVIIDHDQPSYKDPPKEVTYFAYKRINHLNEWISQIQGRETTTLDNAVYDQILIEIKKQKITNMADVTEKKVREILKKLKQNKWYEHSAHIVNKLNGLPIPHFEPELEEKLRNMFKMIQPCFVKYAPPDRKNFLSYSYIMYKMLQLLGRDEYLGMFKLLKSRDKLYQHDIVFKKICEELNWEFIPSL